MRDFMKEICNENVVLKITRSKDESPPENEVLFKVDSTQHLSSIKKILYKFLVHEVLDNGTRKIHIIDSYVYTLDIEVEENGHPDKVIEVIDVTVDFFTNEVLCYIPDISKQEQVKQGISKMLVGLERFNITEKINNFFGKFKFDKPDGLELPDAPNYKSSKQSAEEQSEQVEQSEQSEQLSLRELFVNMPDVDEEEEEDEDLCPKCGRPLKSDGTCTCDICIQLNKESNSIDDL